MLACYNKKLSWNDNPLTKAAKNISSFIYMTSTNII